LSPKKNQACPGSIYSKITISVVLLISLLMHYVCLA
jgi:hypothetical protein